jgi:hypothetical protein
MRRSTLAAVAGVCLLASGCASVTLGLSARTGGIGSDLSDALTIEGYNLSLIFTVIIPWNPLVALLGMGISVVDLSLGIPIYPLAVAYQSMAETPEPTEPADAPAERSTPPVGADQR